MGDNSSHHWSLPILAIGAIGGLVFGGWQSCVAQKHYAVSVQPHLVSNPNVSESADKTYVSLDNVGLGPAIIVWSEVRFKAEEATMAEKATEYAGWPVLKDEASRIGLPSPIRAVHYSPHDALRPQHHENLFGWNTLLSDKCEREIFRELLKDAEYRVCYKSLSGHSWTYIVRLFGMRQTVEGCEKSPDESFRKIPPLQRKPPETSEECLEPGSPRP